ncbi:MAG TPA: helix-turn-helix transcriptional regulator [Pseudolabrys sp.]|jgi:DNA-binding CsgD family transcriptional regulator|nr:helix-turn-helix transcriptional regulator [Pseudolabrys sp.]
MDEIELISLLIGGIYDAALDPSLWPGVLAQAAVFVGGVSAALYAKDAAAKSGNIFYQDGRIEPHYVRLYFDKYVKLDPATTGHFFAKIGQPIATADLIPYDEFLQTRFYKEWVKPQRLVDHVTVVLDKSNTGVALFGVFRHERDGVADAEARRRMRLIAPHVRRAVLIGHVIDLKTAEAATFADTLDGLGAGLFMLDGSGRIVHANAAGHALLTTGDVLKAASGCLLANDPQADRLLHEIFAAAANGDAALGAKGIAVPLSTGDGEHYVAHALPLTSGARRRTGAAYAAATALFVHKAALNTPSPPETIAKTYKLTPTELRVLLAIVEVGGVPEVAEALGVSSETVKTHLGRLYEKTGAGRQADLVKLVAGFASPLAR